MILLIIFIIFLPLIVRHFEKAKNDRFRIERLEEEIEELKSQKM